MSGVVLGKFVTVHERWALRGSALPREPLYHAKSGRVGVWQARFLFHASNLGTPTAARGHERAHAPPPPRVHRPARNPTRSSPHACDSRLVRVHAGRRRTDTRRRGRTHRRATAGNPTRSPHRRAGTAAGAQRRSPRDVRRARCRTVAPNSWDSRWSRRRASGRRHCCGCCSLLWQLDQHTML